MRRLGADEVVDYKKQDFEHVLHGYDAVLGTVKGDTIEKSLAILKPGGRIVSLVGPLDAAFARKKQLNVLLTFVFGLMSRKIMRLASKQDVSYTFMFVRPDGSQLSQVGQLLADGRIQPVIDKVFPFDQAKEALAYLAQGRAKGKVVVKMSSDAGTNDLSSPLASLCAFFMDAWIWPAFAGLFLWQLVQLTRSRATIIHGNPHLVA